MQKTNDAELSGSYAYCFSTYVYTCSLETKTSSLLHFSGPFPHVLLIYSLPERLIASRYSKKAQGNLTHLQKCCNREAEGKKNHYFGQEVLGKYSFFFFLFGEYPDVWVGVKLAGLSCKIQHPFPEIERLVQWVSCQLYLVVAISEIISVLWLPFLKHLSWLLLEEINGV